MQVFWDIQNFRNTFKYHKLNLFWKITLSSYKLNSNKGVYTEYAVQRHVNSINSSAVLLSAGVFPNPFF